MTTLDRQQTPQWLQLLQLGPALQQQVSEVYEGRFPREIRHWLHDVIERLDWASAAVDQGRASALFQDLLLYLEKQWRRSVQENTLLQRPDFLGMRAFLLKHFEGSPIELAVTLSRCLAEEKNILECASKPQVCQRPAEEQPGNVLDEKMSDLRRQASMIEKLSRSLEESYEELHFLRKAQQVEEKTGPIWNSGPGSKDCQEHIASMVERKQALMQQVAAALTLASELVETLTDVELPQWKSRQRLACIGSPVDWSLARLQEWFTAVAEVLFQVLEELQKQKDQNRKYDRADALGLAVPLEQLNQFTASLCTRLCSRALVVEKQPARSSLPQRPLIVKTEVKFSASVRFLVNLPQFLLTVKPAFDKDVEEATTVKGFRRFELKGNQSKVLQECTPGGGLVADFADMKLKETKGRVKGSSENGRIAEELHIIRFECILQHSGLGCSFQTSTLPLVVVSNSSQEAEAWASIMWLNVASDGDVPNLSFFGQPPVLTWSQLSEVLSWQFLSAGGRGLDESQVAELKKRFADADLIQWSQFSHKDSAWFWIDGILDLIKKHLANLWRDGLIMGFVSKKKTRALLEEKPCGTFLLRFSESIREGAVTFSWVEHADGRVSVIPVQPYTKEDLARQSLADSLQHFSQRNQQSVSSNPLLFLYPDQPRQQAFAHYCSSPEPQEGDVSKGYLKRIPSSFCVTPPSSPPRAVPVGETLMELDLGLDNNQLFEEFPSLWDTNMLPELRTPSPPAAPEAQLSPDHWDWREILPSDFS